MNYVQLLLPDFSLILCGYLLCRYTALNRTVWAQVESLVYYFLFPVLLFHSIVKSPLDIGATSKLVSAGWAMGLSGIALVYSVPHWYWFKRYVPKIEYVASAQVAFRFNSFIGLALADRLAGPAGLMLLAVLIGVCVPLFNIAAVWPMARHGERDFLRELVRNPLIIGTATGLAANLLGLTLPLWLQPTVTRIGAAALALGLMAAGAGMQIGALGRAKVLAVVLLTIRHFLLPLVAFGLAREGARLPPVPVQPGMPGRVAQLRQPLWPGRTAAHRGGPVRFAIVAGPPGSGKTVGIVRDYKDYFNSGFWTKTTKRRANYASHGWSQRDAAPAEREIA